jgi:hypothetical protein
MNAKTKYVINLPNTNYFLMVNDRGVYGWVVGTRIATYFNNRELAQKALNASGLEGCEICASMN